MANIRMTKQPIILWLSSLFVLIMVLSSCSSSTSNSGASTASMPQQNSRHYASSSMSPNNSSSQTGTSSNTNGQKTSTSDPGPQYLIKNLKVTLLAKDTRKVASDIQSWISQADPRSSSAGSDYEQVGDNLYNVTVTFSVQASMYPQVYTYLRDFSAQGSHLTGFTESVQDVSHDYVDTSSRIKNLKGEQARLLDLMNHAQALGDVLSIEQRLSDVEGQIETAEEHLNQLNSQITFYTVTISLQPITPTDMVQPSSNPNWSISQTFRDAFAASLAFGQVILTVLVWLLAFGFYLIPIIVILWLIRKWRPQFLKMIPVPTPTRGK